MLAAISNLPVNNQEIKKVSPVANIRQEKVLIKVCILVTLAPCI